MAQQNPGQDGHEDGIGHVQNIGLGHRGVTHGLIEAVDGDAVAQGPADQQMVALRDRSLPPEDHDRADHDKAQQKSEKRVKGGIDGHHIPGPADHHRGEVEAEGRRKNGQASQKAEDCRRLV